MLVSAIVAMAKNRVIGFQNQIPWYIPADLKYFKKTTLNHHVIMGRNTFHSIGRPLPNRVNIIVSRDPFFIAADCLIAHTIEEALTIALDHGEEEAFIIGGGQIYDRSLSYLDRVYLTEVDLEPQGDVFFPALNANEWKRTFQESHPADDKNEFAYKFKILDRIISSDEEE
jgi:dihydrofolate reductase